MNISDGKSTVEGTVGSNKKVGINYAEEESEDKNVYVSIILFFSTHIEFSSWPSNGNNIPWSTCTEYTKFWKW